MEGNRKHMKTSFHPMAWCPCKFHLIRWGCTHQTGMGVQKLDFDEHLASTPFVRGSQSPHVTRGLPCSSTKFWWRNRKALCLHMLSPREICEPFCQPHQRHACGHACMAVLMLMVRKFFSCNQTLYV